MVMERATPGVLLSIWTLYDHPTDFPNYYVARRHEVLSNGSSSPTGDTVQTTKLEVLRDEMRAKGLYPMPRDPSDDPKIIESWI